jgi:hypothetical protein
VQTRNPTVNRTLRDEAVQRQLLLRSSNRNPEKHLVFYPLKQKPMSVVIGKWDRALV